MRDCRTRQPSELYEKLERYAHRRGDEHCDPVMASDPSFRTACCRPERWREPNGRKKESVENELADAELRQRPLAEQKPGAPETACGGEGGKGLRSGRINLQWRWTE